MGKRYVDASEELISLDDQSCNSHRPRPAGITERNDAPNTSTRTDKTKNKNSEELFASMSEVSEVSNVLEVSEVSEVSEDGSEAVRRAEKRKERIVQSFDGRFYRYGVLNRRLSENAHSIVYLGVVESIRCVSNTLSLEPGQTVVVKIMHLSTLSKIDHEYALREETICRNLMNHTCHNIVQVYDVVNEKHTLYIVMEYMSGSTLSSLLIRPMKEIYAKYYFSQILNALLYLRNMNIVHGDIKPGNVLVSGDHSVLKLCDFGFSFIYVPNGMSKPKVICGSPLYMAPELRSEDYLPHDGIDIWALGLILHEMIFGYHPFKGNKDSASIIEAAHRFEIGIPEQPICKRGMMLLSSMIEINENQRLDLDSVMQNSWISRRDAPAEHDNNLTIRQERIEFQDRLDRRYQKVRDDFTLSRVFYSTDASTRSSSAGSCGSCNNRGGSVSRTTDDTAKSPTFTVLASGVSFKSVSVESVLFGSFLS